MDSVHRELKDESNGQEELMEAAPLVTVTAAEVPSGMSSSSSSNAEAVIVSSEFGEVLTCMNEIISELEDVVQASYRSDSKEAVTLKGLVDEVTDVTEHFKMESEETVVKNEFETMKEAQMESVSSIEVDSSYGEKELGSSMPAEREDSKPFEAVVKDVLQRRDVTQKEEDSSNFDSDSDSLSSSSSDEEDVSSDVDVCEDGDDEESFTLEDVLNNKTKKNSGYSGLVRTKGELRLEDLPPIQDLKISIDKKEIQLVGQVLSIVDCLVVVQSVADAPALNLDSILFLDGGEPLGQIFDVFGPVVRPLYSVRFNKAKDIKTKNVTVGSTIFYAPQKSEFTSFVFAEQLRKMKGSDASWQDNNEPPEEHLEYSDDEQEKLAKARRMNRYRKESNRDEQQKPKQKRQTERPNWKQNKTGQKQYQQNYVADSTRVAVVKPASFSPRFQNPPLMRPPPPPFSYSMPRFQPPSLPIQTSNPCHNAQQPLFPYRFTSPPPLNLFKLGTPPPPPPSTPPPPPPPPPLPPVPTYQPFVPRQPPPSPPSVVQPPRQSIWIPPRSLNQQPLQNIFQSNSNTQNYNVQSGEVLPNPFRTQTNTSSNAETLNVPRFPPVGFVPKM